MPFKSEKEAINRKMAIIDAMTQKSLSPYQTQVIGGHAIPYTFGDALGSMGVAGIAAYKRKQLEDQSKDVEDREAQGLDMATQKVLEAMTGRPGGDYHLSEQEQFGDEQIPGLKNEPIEPDLNKAALMAVSDPYLSENRGVQSVITAMLKGKAGSDRGSYYTQVPGAEGTMVMNARTGEMEYRAWPKEFSGPIAYDPLRAEQVAAGKTKGKEEATRTFNMAGTGEIISEAEKYLTGEATGTKPTQSGAGSILDTAAGFFGISPKGATEATTLRAIGGALTAKMPRMEGPQSDRDTQLYREMAGQVGDASIPVEQRLRALSVVKKIWQKYEGGTQMQELPQQAPANTNNLINMDSEQIRARANEILNRK